MRRAALVVLIAATCGWLAAHPLVAATVAACTVTPLLFGVICSAADRQPEDRLAAHDRRRVTSGGTR